MSCQSAQCKEGPLMLGFYTKIKELCWKKEHVRPSTDKSFTTNTGLITSGKDAPEMQERGPDIGNVPQVRTRRGLQRAGQLGGGQQGLVHQLTSLPH